MQRNRVKMDFVVEGVCAKCSGRLVEMRRGLVCVLVLMVALAGGRAWSQDPVPTPAAQPAQTPAAPPAADPAKPAAPAEAVAPATPAPATDATAPAAGEQQPAAGQQTPAAEAPTSAPQAPTAQSAPATPGAKPAVQTAKKGKPVYTGPTTVIELPPTPMLDEEGKQRLDPDGKPMFNPPVKQERDKFGHPMFDKDGKPVFQTAKSLGYDDKGKKIPAQKEKKAKTVAVSITRGTLTVDGMIGKAGLNYEIADLKFIYMYAPWIGTVVVSNAMFPGAKLQANGFDQHTLTVQVEDHTFQLYSDKLLLGKNPEPAYVMVDRDFQLQTKVPVMGYGETLKAPYNWPGAKENPVAKGALKPPPVPANLRPAPLLAKCPPGQMRDPMQAVLPGQAAPPPPCVPITAVRQAAAVAAAKPAAVAPATPQAAAAPDPAAAPPAAPAPAEAAPAAPAAAPAAEPPPPTAPATPPPS